MRLKGICCVCGVLYRDGETIDGMASHGYCPLCFDAEMKNIAAEFDGAPAPNMHPAPSNLLNLLDAPNIS